WLGQCPKCGQWNTLTEETVRQGPVPAVSGLRPPSVMRLQDAVEDGMKPFSSGLGPLDRLLGAGLVPGAVTLAGGEPGIGKSTLLLQVAGHVSAQGRRVLYASGEETLAQIRRRGERLRVLNDNLLAIATASCDDVIKALGETRPALLILDSVQTVACTEVERLPGNVNQVRAVASSVIEACRSLQVAGILVGHVTKEGALAGPRVLEHMVDTVISLEGDRRQAFRLMRVSKNRFGPSDEMLVFRMGQDGMEIVADPSTFFLEDRNPFLSGTAVVMACEGRRPLAVEVQALATSSCFSIPRRAALGFDTNRLNLILAVLEKRLRLNFSHADIYAKVGGGVRLQDPGLDLGVATAVLSSFYDLPVPEKAVFFGEMDLNGQIRPVSCQEQRLNQAKRLGFKPIVMPGSVQTITDLAKGLFRRGGGQGGNRG
ncbi:MAG: DNA repair protein RadA, partial [Desulfovibrionaceae bacterium]|nr:DNA repair protein RadA [Desulfovibrionaceae bacterium]